jgi:hypothetical protein
MSCEYAALGYGVAISGALLCALIAILDGNLSKPKVVLQPEQFRALKAQRATPTPTTVQSHSDCSQTPYAFETADACRFDVARDA